MTRACASRSLVSCSVVTMRTTFPRSTFCSPAVSRIVSSACSHGTLRSEIGHLALHVVADHDVAAALGGEDAEQVHDVGVP
jgi:hypothetical protein